MSTQAMKLFIMLNWMLSAVLAAEVHVELRLLRREHDARLDLDSAATDELGKVAVQISSAAHAKSLEGGSVKSASSFVVDDGFNSEVVAEIFDTDHNVIDGLACPNSGTALSYEPDCEFLRDNSPFGFSLSQSDISYNAQYASIQRTTTLGRQPPVDIYNSWVLPFRILNENPEQWRLPFQQAFASVVLPQPDLVTAVEALIPKIWALRTNASFMASLNISENSMFNNNISFVNGSDSIQPLAHTLLRGTANSMGLSIYAAAVLRSVGIPARVVGVNHWGTAAAGNYFWVEFWTCRAPDGTDVWSFF